jgi:hypothetical protein
LADDRFERLAAAELTMPSATSGSRGLLTSDESFAANAQVSEQHWRAQPDCCSELAIAANEIAASDLAWPVSPYAAAPDEFELHCAQLIRGQIANGLPRRGRADRRASG